MRFKAGMYQVLSNDEATYVHGGADEIQTTHLKNVWLKDLSTEEVFNINLKNSAVPIKPGAKIGLAFLNGEIIAFKRRGEIPVEDPVSMKHWHNPIIAALWAIFFGICMSIPILGYLIGMVAGGMSLLTGMNLLGRYSNFPGNRLFAAFLLIISCYSWIPYQRNLSLSALADSLTGTAILLTLGLLAYQMYKIKIEKSYFKRAVSEINAAWKN
ncbi:hypothetical protein N5F23_07015 [Pseudomonas sichuanensis]|uniref:hypothetical protein n=1 Tax=Pseudomonas sichuanensis TaxID=2213015 RepID=UPI002449FFAE|nr:hypothetical protein [Pseudomonas sichuanensis]MDH0730273.1 hypothetical protein [Pseudomonas sichuanensis]MDH1582341.1 hypothetical protein [Pseudomonas sichuanensis]MDH1591738.1 hypothetical protein [Pseudomonas sichuanensis]MDH1599535.1 hypothetical protein [Pseudomonas sichuanensis]